MNIQQCWQHFVKAEELNQDGHWPEAYQLYDDVLSYLPSHMLDAVESSSTKPCQLMSMFEGLRSSSISQSEILNKLGRREEAFELLNQTYGHFQFLALESSNLIEAVSSILQSHCDELYKHITAFCNAQRSATWMLELESLQRAHHYFDQLKQYKGVLLPATIN